MKKTANTTNTTVNTTINTNTADAKEAKFYEDLGRLIAKYYFDGIPFKKTTFVLNPDFTPADTSVKEEAKEKKPSKVDVLKKYGKEGIGVKNTSCIAVSAETMTIIENIIVKYPDIKINSGSHRKGYINCIPAAGAIIDRFDGGDKLVDEAINILIKTGQHNSDYGITRVKLELVTRILALHQKRGRSKVKEALINILTEHTINSLTVLAKDTKKYVQRSKIDMLVLYVESEIAKVDGVRNQLEK